MLRLTKLRTRLSAEAQEKMRRGQTLEKLLIQPNYQPVSLEEEIILFYAFKKRILEFISEEMLNKFIQEIFSYISTNEPQLLEELREKKDLTPEIRKELDRVIVEFFRKARGDLF
jgi:F-type H+-transporting ATPase subunit alpha